MHGHTHQHTLKLHCPFPSQFSGSSSHPALFFHLIYLSQINHLYNIYCLLLCLPERMQVSRRQGAWLALPTIIYA